MGSPYLSNNETILLSTHNLIINTVAAEAILTSHRLMLIDYSHPQLLPQDIPFAAIETVTIGENSEKVPVLSLSIAAQDGTRHMIGLTFAPVQRTKRTAERDEWAGKLKEMSMAALQEKGIVPAELVPPWIPGPLPDEKTDEMAGGEAKSEKENVYRPLHPVPKRRDQAKAGGISRKTTVLALVGIVIVAAILGAYFLAPLFPGRGEVTPATPTTIPTPALTTVPATIATPLPTPTPVPTMLPLTTATPVPARTGETVETSTPAQQYEIPATGVWVRVRYDGKFEGSIGKAGGLRSIAGSGEGLYQIPMVEGIVLATVQKLDTSGNVLSVDVFRNGELVKSVTTRTPLGTIDTQVKIPAQQTVQAAATAAP